MRQVIFNDKFTGYDLEKLSYWKDFSECPSEIQEFIRNTSKNVVIYDDKDDSYYCSKCLHKLDDNYLCRGCFRQYDKVIYDSTKYNKNIIYEYDFDKYNYYDSIYYYAFDVQNEEVFLYIFREKLSNYNSYFIIDLDVVFHIQEDGVLNISDNKFYKFDELEKKLEEDDYFYNNYFGYNYVDISNMFLYTGNLNDLKNTIYKYSYIWQAVSYFDKNNVSPFELIYVPLCIKSFEYLIKFKLYNLAFNSCKLISKGRSFSKVLGIGKEYLKFMQEMDISYSELQALKLCKKRDVELIRFISNDVPFFDIVVNTYKMNLYDVFKYCKNNNYDYYLIYEYEDYLDYLFNLGYDMSNKELLYPNDLLEAHDRLLVEMEVVNDPIINLKIQNLSNVLNFNHYDDGKYVIVSADSIESIIDEGTQQHNCLRTYIERYGNNDCQIYFLREKNNSSKSFVTIEVQNNKVIQARSKFNELPNKEIMDVIRKWERNLVLVEKE